MNQSQWQFHHCGIVSCCTKCHMHYIQLICSFILLFSFTNSLIWQKPMKPHRNCIYTTSKKVIPYKFWKIRTYTCNLHLRYTTVSSHSTFRLKALQQHIKISTNLLPRRRWQWASAEDVWAVKAIGMMCSQRNDHSRVEWNASSPACMQGEQPTALACHLSNPQTWHYSMSY